MPLTAPLLVAVPLSALRPGKPKHESVLVAALLAATALTLAIFWWAG